MIPPQFKPEMIEFRKRLRKDDKTVTAEILTEYDTEIRELYFDIYNVMIQPPELRNTDGDLLKFHTIRYHIDSPELAFQRLNSLSVIETEEKLRNQADFD